MTHWLGRMLGETQLKLLILLRRSRRTITALSAELGLTDNAVRTHVAALGRDGIVEHVGTERDTGGKPARVYALTEAGEELFPKAYAMVLAGLVEEIKRLDGDERATAMLRAVGERTAWGRQRAGDLKTRVEDAATVLQELGGDVEVVRTTDGWRLQGYACPLSAVTANHAEVCALARGIVEQMTGESVVECCERGRRPRCAFSIEQHSTTNPVA